MQLEIGLLISYQVKYDISLAVFIQQMNYLYQVS